MIVIYFRQIDTGFHWYHIWTRRTSRSPTGAILDHTLAALYYFRQRGCIICRLSVFLSVSNFT